jgi:hypothetical protein
MVPLSCWAWMAGIARTARKQMAKTLFTITLDLLGKNFEAQAGAAFYSA